MRKLPVDAGPDSIALGFAEMAIDSTGPRSPTVNRRPLYLDSGTVVRYGFTDLVRGCADGADRLDLWIRELPPNRGGWTGLVCVRSWLRLDSAGGEIAGHVRRRGVRVMRGFDQVGKGEAGGQLAADLLG